MDISNATSGPERGLDYRAEIDSLRAIAIIPVVLFHLDPSNLRGGYLGVDVFFVLSGYLISAILLRDMDLGVFRMRRFYARRVRRLVPVILSVVIATLVVANFFLADGQRVYVAKQSIAALTSVSNIFVWRSTGDYWGPTAESTALLHTWSLSVEEQFYLLFPVVLALVHRWMPKRVTAFFLLVIVTSGLGYLIVVAARPSAAFYLLPTRAWELACGGLLASMERTGKQQSDRPSDAGDGSRLLSSGLGCLAGLVLILLAYWMPSDGRSNEWNTVIAVTGTMMFLATPKGTKCFDYLSWAPMVYIGRVSYSWYMWHWPIIVLNDLAGVYANTWWVAITGLVVAIASYHWIEQPTRRRKGILPWLLGVFFLALGLAVFSIIPRPIQPADPALYKTSTWYGSYYNSYPEGETSDWYHKIVTDVDVPKRTSTGDEFENGGIRFTSDDTPDVVLLGDSHATMWAHLVHRLTRERNRSLSVWAINGVDPFFADENQTPHDDSIKTRYDAARKRMLPQWQPELTVISVRWSMHDPERARQLIGFVASCSRNVLLIGATPELRIGDENARDFLIRNGITPAVDRKYDLPRVMSDTVLEAPKYAKSLADAIPNVHYVPVSELYENGRLARVLAGRYCIFLDDDHLTDFGTWLAKPVLEQQFDQLLSRPTK